MIEYAEIDFGCILKVVCARNGNIGEDDGVIPGGEQRLLDNLRAFLMPKEVDGDEGIRETIAICRRQVTSLKQMHAALIVGETSRICQTGFPFFTASAAVIHSA